jgi:hypothetical protein
VENLYAYIPGLKVITPSTPYDAKGLLKSAIRDDNPIVFIGAKCYTVKGPVPDEYMIPLGQGDMKREGQPHHRRMVEDGARCLDAAANWPSRVSRWKLSIHERSARWMKN